MPRPPTALTTLRLCAAVALTACGLLIVLTSRASAQTITITNLQLLTQTLHSSPQVVGAVDLQVTVCAASRPQIGVVIVQDESGVELLQLGERAREFSPGERLRIRGDACLLRRREIGVQISSAPVAINDGLHAWKPVTGAVSLPAGKVPLRLEWFNYWRTFGLRLTVAAGDAPPQPIESFPLWHEVVTAAGVTNLQTGLRAECFEGAWETLPDFNLLQPVKTAAATNLDLGIRTRDELVGVRYTGFLEVPSAGRYEFTIWSDDGSLVSVGESRISILSFGNTNIFPARPGNLGGGSPSNVTERCWTSLEGRVRFLSRAGAGATFALGTDYRTITVRLADAGDLNLATLVHARVRVTGLGRSALTSGGSVVIGTVAVASAKDLVILEPAPTHAERTLPITSVAQVQNLPIDEARKALPVHLRGTVTGAFKTSQEHWMSFQDDTRGIFVQLSGVTNATPAFGEFWEVKGRSATGNFAPIVVAEAVARLGDGLLPVPVRPTWAELLNGSRDVQWAELTGLVTEVHTNTIVLHLPEGRLDVEVEGKLESELKPFLKSIVRIRGVLYAVWDAATREVRVGRVLMRSPAISVDAVAPADPFDAVERTPRELLRFDAQASAFRPVKVRGQIVYADAAKLFLEAENTGLRLVPAQPTTARPGDLVEVVGYPDLGRSELVLREVLLRRTGQAPLPPPRRFEESNLTTEDVNSLRVRVEGRLLGWHTEESGPVLEMQSGARLYLARLATRDPGLLAFRAGSRLALEGIYVGRGASHRSGAAENESFELLLNSIADITVLSQPTWWTLPRLLGLSGVLLVILAITVAWNTQLRRQVEQRTSQLQREIRERERLERQAALESERSRIARDLHDDLGSSLTEISVLASTGQLPQTNGAGQTSLFQSISSRARSLIAALDVIVWAVDPEDNSLQSLADYLTGYTSEYFSHTQIACRFKVPVSFPPVTLEGRVRHDLLMAVKEALNNVVRHADATELEFRLAVVDDSLEIDIADNGKGLDPATSGGHGLKNLSARLTKLGGTCTVESRAGGGTLVRLRLPLTASPRELAQG